MKMIVLCLVFIGCAGMADAIDYKAYYEKQRAEHRQSFVPPEAGSEIELKLKNRTTITGSLSELTPDGVAVETKRGAKSYRREALSDESRALLFAEDYAKAKAYEKTRNLKFHNETAARLERGEKLKVGLSVKHDIDKKKDKEVSAEEYSSETKITQESVCTLDISLSNPSAFDTIVNLRWYFIIMDHNAEGGPELAVGNWSGQWTPVKKRERYRHQVESPVFKMTEQVNEYENEDDGSVKKVNTWGRECIGYLVLVKYQDMILAMDSSAEEFQTEEFLAKLPVPEHEKPKAKALE